MARSLWYCKESPTNRNDALYRDFTSCISWTSIILFLFIFLLYFWLKMFFLQFTEYVVDYKIEDFVSCLLQSSLFIFVTNLGYCLLFCDIYNNNKQPNYYLFIGLTITFWHRTIWEKYHLWNHWNYLKWHFTVMFLASPSFQKCQSKTQDGGHGRTKI